MNTEQSIKHGLAYLQEQQLSDGNFLSYSSQDPELKADKLMYHTTFFASNIALALHQIDGAQSITQNIVEFLLSQKSFDWSFNYWDRTSSAAKLQPYPDDLDDSFSALAALYQARQTLFRGDVMAKIAQLLIVTESQEGGPYKTWLVETSAVSAWQDVDIAVNANVAYFLSLHEVELPNIANLIESALALGKVSSPYYPDIYPILYFIGRWYHGSERVHMQKLLLQQQRDGSWDNPLHTAMAITTLLRLGYDTHELKAAVEFLYNTQRTDGSWDASAFCIDPTQKGLTHYAGSASLTTAYCIEALTRYEHARLISREIIKKQTSSQLYKLVSDRVEQKIAQLPRSEIRTYNRQILRDIIKQDSDQQIVLLPWLIARSTELRVSPDTLMSLGEASLWGWMAYTTYDDFLDHEGDIKLLPSANVCLRNLERVLSSTLSTNIEFQTEVVSIMNRLDAANAWEMTHCRFDRKADWLVLKSLPKYGNYWQLADRSLGHTIAGLGVLYGTGLAMHDVKLATLRQFFYHYLVARQLNDDAHDWAEDLDAGHINAVGVMILKRWKQEHPKRKRVNLTKNHQELQTIMWDHVIPQVCREIYKHIALARKSAAEFAVDTSKLEMILKPIEIATEKAESVRRETLEFIAGL